MAKILLFGDSIMGGFKNGRHTSAITKPIQQAFPKDTVINVSISGATTDDALDYLSLNVLNAKPHVVVLAFGANDAAVKLGMTPGRFNTNLNRIIEKIGPKKVILVSPPYTNWRVASNQSWPRILQFELVAEHVAHTYHLPYLDLAEEMQKSTHVNRYLQKDGIHFSDSGNRLLVKKLIPLIASKVKRKTFRKRPYSDTVTKQKNQQV